MAKDIAKTLGDLLADSRDRRRAIGGRGRRPALGLALPDREDEPTRDDEAHGVDCDSDRRSQQADETTADRLAEDRRRGGAHLELRVALDELVRFEDGRQERLVGDVEEDGQEAVDEADDIELWHRQDAKLPGDRDRQQRDRPAEVAGDEDEPAGEAVDPGAGWQGEQQERQELDRPEKGDLEGLGLEQDRGDEGQRDEADLGPEEADRRGRPEAPIVAVTA